MVKPRLATVSADQICLFGWPLNVARYQICKKPKACVYSLRLDIHKLAICSLGLLGLLRPSSTFQSYPQLVSKIILFFQMFFQEMSEFCSQNIKLNFQDDSPFPSTSVCLCKTGQILLHALLVLIFLVLPDQLGLRTKLLNILWFFR